MLDSDKPAAIALPDSPAPPFALHWPRPYALISSDLQEIIECNALFRELWPAVQAQAPAAFQNVQVFFREYMGGPLSEKEIVLGDGRVFCVTATALRTPDAPALLYVFEDVTRYKKREADLLRAKSQLEEALAAKQTYLSTLTHELRTPLGAVIAMAHLLADDSPLPHQLDNLKTLQSSSENLLTLINDVLDYGKIEARKIVFEQTVFPMDELLKNVKRASQYRADEKGIAIDVCHTPGLPAYLIGDPARLLQILNNLVSNAVKFTQKGSISISTEEAYRKQAEIAIRFTVSDTGIGIAPEKLSGIFDDYTQADTDTTRRFGGTGLGLAITKRLLELQGSRIEVSSRLGVGSSFSFVLTFRIGAKPSVREAARKLTGHADWHRYRILLVEDNDVNIIVASKFLKTWGLQPDYARNGSEAIDRIGSKRYDLVLMDIQMPVMDGLEATRILRQQEGAYFQQLTIIALTANALDDVRDKCLATGMNDFVTKPFTPESLHACLKKHLPSLAHTPAGPAAPPAAAVPATPAFAAHVWQKVMAVSADDPETQQHLFTLSVENIRQFKHDYRHALLSRDIHRLDHLLHKTRTLFHMLALDEIELEARQGFRLISDPQAREADLRESSDRINRVCDRILA